VDADRKSKHANIPRDMVESGSTSQYVLGSTDEEQERLIRQAARLDPYTERLFRDAGMGPGQRILDIGSGVGDVAMLAARLVGPSGEIVGVERDERSIARARARVAEAGLHNVTFTHSDVSQIRSAEPFDGVVGRFILQFLPNAAAVLRSLSQLIRPGGVVAFHEPTWSPLLLLTAQLPLWSACASLIRKTFQCSGANPDMELVLFRAFEEAGLLAPNMWMEMPMGSDSFFTGWVYDLLCSVRPQMQQHNLSCETLGDFDTLRQRLQTELATSKSPGACIGLVAAWSRVSARPSPR
jgi:2-polyprenyl-3-methyl-5-hydroxy-6-metoxy-1,4-benzoquinol methylase